VSSGGALDLGKGTVTGTLTATGNGAISQASGNGSGLTVTQAASFTQNANGADVLLGNTNNQFNSSVTFSPAAGVEIGSLSLAATSAPGGTVTLPGAVSGNLTLNYGSSALTVPNSIVVGGNLSMTGSDITLNGNESTGGSQTYNGHLLLGAATVLTATAGGVTFNGTVDNATSTTQEALTINAAGPVAFDGAVGAIGNGALSSLTVTSTGASAGITQGGLLYVSGASTFNAGTSGAITLGESTNQLQGPVSLTGGTVTLANSDATILGSGTVTGALTLTSAGAGGISQATGTTLTATGGGSITASNGAIALGNQ
ncbi:hypothetical protein ISS99_00060, partial [Dyella mobilis]|nr:hypothetical protein [Dyella mobilis]